MPYGISIRFFAFIFGFKDLARMIPVPHFLIFVVVWLGGGSGKAYG